METIIIKLGGSLFIPSIIDNKFINTFVQTIEPYKNKYKFIVVVGGGNIARQYQSTLRACGVKDNKSLDTIGINVTKLNAKMFASILSLTFENVQVLNSLDDEITSNIVVASGYDVGHSTDFDTIYLANRIDNNIVVILSNVTNIYTDDPKINKNARALDITTWSDLKGIVGSEWLPGKNLPIDPSAVNLAEHTIPHAMFTSFDNLSDILKYKKLNNGTHIYQQKFCK